MKGVGDRAMCGVVGELCMSQRSITGKYARCGFELVGFGFVFISWVTMVVGNKVLGSISDWVRVYVDDI